MRDRPGARGSLIFGPGVAVLTALVLLTGLATSAVPVAAASRGPTVYWGAKTGPMDIPAPRIGTVAVLPLPPGRYFVTATAVLLGRGSFPPGDDPTAGCVLQVGSASEEVMAAPTWAGLGGSRVPILLTVAGRLKSPGKARLRCIGETRPENVGIRDIRITAIKVGRLTTREIGAPTKTTGSGSPRVISVSDQGGASIAGDDSYHDASTLALPAGRWWIIAKAVAAGGGTPRETYRCRLVAGSDHDDMAFGMTAPGATPGFSIPLGLQVVHTFAAPGMARLRCQGPASFEVFAVTITAVKAGRLTNRWLDAGIEATGGSGSPRIISGWSDGPRSIPVKPDFKTIRKLDLPKGRWTVLAKLWFEADVVPTDGTIRRTLCRLVFGRDKTPSRVRYTDSFSKTAPLVLSIVHRSTSRQPVKLQCRRTSYGGTGHALSIKITAVKAGSLVKRRL